MHRLPLVFLLAAVASAAVPPWRPFSPDSPWNQPIPANAAPDRASSALVDDLASRGPWQVNIRDWSISLYFVDAAHTPKHDVGDSRPGVYGRGFEFPRRIPIPDGAVASPPVGPDSDNHLSVVDPALGLEWGMWAARQDASGRWFTGLGAVTDLRGTGVAPPWFACARQLDAHRGRASGFPLVAGLIRLDEIAAGRIDHALCFAYDHCRSGLFVPPASTSQVAQAEANDARGIPMGGRIQLDPSWDVDSSALSPAGKIIARALQRYGAYCGDYAGANVLYAENSPAAVARWAGVLAPHDLATVFTPEFIRRHFRVIDQGDLLPGQNLSVPPPYLLTLIIDGCAPPRLDPYARTIELPRGRASVRVRWATYPAGTSLAIDDTVVPPGGGPAELSTHTRVTLFAPDGTVSHWRVVAAPP